MNQPQPGWYPDPSGAPQQRWWDGSKWSDATRGDVAPEPEVPVDAAAAAASSRSGPLVRGLLLVVVFGVLVGGGILIGMGLADTGDDGGTDGIAVEDPTGPAEVAEPEDPGGVDADPPGVRAARTIDPRLGPNRQLASISPDGSAVLETSIEEAGTQVCVRDLEADEPEFCDDSIRFETRYASWSDDGRRVVLGEGEAFFRLSLGGNLVLFDRDEGRARSVGETEPAERGSTSYRALVRPVLSPSGDRIAAVQFDGSSETRLVVIDLSDEQEILSVPVNRMAWSLRWEPSGTAVWVSTLDQSDSMFERVDPATGEVRTLENRFLLEEDPGSSTYGELIQISDDGKVGLALFTELYGARSGVEGGLPFAGLIDLETGASAPLLRREHPDEGDASYFLPHATRLGSSGASVVVGYFDERPTYRDDAVEQTLRLVRISAESIFSGSPDRETLVDDLSALTEVPVPYVVTTTLRDTLQVLPLPGSDTQVLLPLDRRSYDGPAPQRVEALLELTLDHSF